MSSPHHGRHRTVEEVERMLDIIVANEGSPDVVQISGGEPTVHPHFFEILDVAKKEAHQAFNAQHKWGLPKILSSQQSWPLYAPDFEIYLQFDSFKPEVLQQLRGEDLTGVRLKALEHLNEVNLSTTLVVTLQQGLNDDEIGKIIDFALQQNVRGVTFQPVQAAGRLENFDPAKDRITMTDVRTKNTGSDQCISTKRSYSGSMQPGCVGDGLCFEAGRQSIFHDTLC